MLVVFCFCGSVHQILVYVSILLNQKISYMNSDESFLENGTTQVLQILKSYHSTVPFILFLSLSRITWWICIPSCNNSLPACCKFVLLHSVLIPLFSCRYLGRILMWWQRGANRNWLVYDEHLIAVFFSC